MASCSDDIVWQVINHQFCAYKLTTPQKESFCRNEYNVNGVCSRLTCPLANSKYATVRNVNGRIYLYIKTAERQHMPNKWWERIKLSRNYETALQQIDQHLAYWSEFLVDKCKQRLTRLVQVATAERRLALKEQERHYAHTAPKVRRRERTRERKALVAAKLERAIEKELLDRLKSGAYGDQPLNVDENVWRKVLQNVEDEGEQGLEQEEEEEDDDDSDSGEIEYVEDDDDEVVDMEDLEKWLQGSDVSASDLSDDGDSSDDSDDDDGDKKASSGDSRPSKKRRGHVEIEFEQEGIAGTAP